MWSSHQISFLNENYADAEHLKSLPSILHVIHTHAQRQLHTVFIQFYTHYLRHHCVRFDWIAHKRVLINKCTPDPFSSSGSKRQRLSSWFAFSAFRMRVTSVCDIYHSHLIPPQQTPVSPAVSASSAFKYQLNYSRTINLGWHFCQCRYYFSATTLFTHSNQFYIYLFYFF